MTKKPEALLLAEALEQTHPHQAAAELRRQHKLIGELVAMLERCENAIYNIGGEHVTDLRPAISAAEAATDLLARIKQEQ